MRILLVSASLKGGAGIAAYRLYTELLKSKHKVSICYGTGLKVYIESENGKKFAGYNVSFFYFLAFSLILNFLKTQNTFQSVSTSLLRTFLSKRINSGQFDIVHLHWFGHEFLSISDILKIKTRVVITLHDAWLIQGLHHLPAHIDLRQISHKKLSRFRVREKLIRYLDFKVRQNKAKLSEKGIYYISPSDWLTNEFNLSEFGVEKKIVTIANVVDPIYLQQEIGELLTKRQVNSGCNLLFSSFNAIQDYNKGFDLFLESINYLDDINFNIIILGDNFPNQLEPLRSRIKLVPLTSDKSLIRQTFLSATVCVVPSRTENASQTAIESQLMGTPVVAFRTTGMPSLISHKVTGYLANCFDAKDFAAGIRWIHENQNFAIHSQNIIESARLRVKHDNSLEKHISMYQKLNNDV